MNSTPNGLPQSVTQVTGNLAKVRERVQRALVGARREPDETAILAVSKQQPAGAIEAAFQAGQRDFGENFVQEAANKIEALEHLDITWHFIGHIQSNKTRDIARLFHWVHTVDRPRIASRLNEQRSPHAPPIEICIQVNQANEPQKGGVAPEKVAELARAILELPRLRLRGLMSLPPATDDPDETAPYFAALRQLKREMSDEGIPLDTLSMGMSSDLEVAIREGSTIVRVGTAIFGPRRRQSQEKA